MFLAASYVASLGKPLEAYLQLPINAIMVAPGTQLRLAAAGAKIDLVFECRIEHDAVTPIIVATPMLDGGERRTRCLQVDIDREALGQLAADVAAALAVLLERSVSLYSSGKADAVVPQNDADRRVIAEWGTDQLHFGLGAGRASMVRAREELRAEQITSLLKRSAGAQLYADALTNATATARFRDYWRVRESAFCLIDSDLVQALSQYQPALDLGFAKAELEALHTLRGRASHARSRKAPEEVLTVARECEENFPRVKSLAKCVLFTKKSWGWPTSGVESIDPFVEIAYAQDGRVAFVD